MTPKNQYVIQNFQIFFDILHKLCHFFCFFLYSDLDLVHFCVMIDILNVVVILQHVQHLLYLYFLLI